MTEKAKGTFKLSASTLITCGSVLTVCVMGFANQGSDIEHNKESLNRHEQIISNNSELIRGNKDIIIENKADNRAIISALNEVKYELRENRTEMKRWEFEREGVNK